jgi:hypothetical protein
MFVGRVFETAAVDRDLCFLIKNPRKTILGNIKVSADNQNQSCE